MSLYDHGGKKSRFIDAEALQAECEGRWLEILSALAPGLNDAIKKPGKHVACPVHGGEDGFRLFKDANITGGGICNTCDGGKGYKTGITLLRWYHGDMDFLETLEMIADYIGFENRSYMPSVGVSRPIPEAYVPLQQTKEELEKQKKDDARLSRRLVQMWDESHPLTAPAAEPARLYFARRGLRTVYLKQCSELRFHPSLPYYDEDEKHLGNFPAIIARVRDPNGTPVTIHRTYLDEEGFKAPVPKAKKLMPAPSNVKLTGCGIQLFPVKYDENGLATTPLGVTEGIETAFAVIEAHQGQLPVWSTINAALFQRFTPPDGVTSVCGYADLDKSKAGTEAAVGLRSKLNEEGIEFKGWLPDKKLLGSDQKSVDWLDVLNMVGCEYIPLSIEIQ